MREIIRKIHLYAGLVIVLFVMMYFISGYEMVRGRDVLGQRSPTIERRTMPLRFTGPRTVESLAEHVSRTYGYHGRIEQPGNPPTDGSIRFSIHRPGTHVEADIPATGDSIRLRITHGGWRGALNDLHRIHGYQSGSILFNLVVFFNDLASISMILFALSGVYLWWTMTKKRLLGILCLSASCGYAIAIVAYLMLAR